MTVMVPSDSAGRAGLRRVIGEDDVERVLAVLRDDISQMPKNWNRRFKHNRDKMKTGDVFELAEVVRNLAIRDFEKGLSTGEKQMFTRAKKILSSELMYALDMEEKEAEEYLDDLLEETNRSAPRRRAEGVRAHGASARPDAVATALVAAAGSGERLGAGRRRRSSSWPAGRWSPGACSRSTPPRAIDAVVIAAPPGGRATSSRESPREAAPGLAVRRSSPGGDSRSESVARALAATPARSRSSSVHDAARPLVTPELIDRCVEQLERWGCDGVVAAARAVDTIKEADAGGRVLATLERSQPVGGADAAGRSGRGALRAALADGDLERAYDDAQLVEAAGGDVRIVEAPRQNLKVTTAARPADRRAAAR